MTHFEKTAVLGAGVIGASWTALFLAAGKDVCVFDVSDTVQDDVSDYVEKAWPTLVEIGLAVERRRGTLSIASTPEEAVREARVPSHFVRKRGVRRDRFGVRAVAVRRHREAEQRFRFVVL